MRRLLLPGILLSSLVAAFAIAEVALRASGYAPWVTHGAGSPVMYEPDPVLGWHPIPGRRWYGPYSRGAKPVRVTVNDDRSRDTGPADRTDRPEVLLLGCSYTMGWAVSDDETFAWLLQQTRPDLHVVNDGVMAYGTFQSLLLLEELIRNGVRPAR